MKNPYFWARLFAVLMLVVFSIPSEPIETIANLNKFMSYMLSDKMLHAVVFGIFVWLWCAGTHKKGHEPTPYLTVFLGAGGYGFFIELWQYLLPFRSFDGIDLVFDLLGIVIGIFIFKLIKTREWLFFRKT